MRISNGTIELTAAERQALEQTRRKLNFTEAERAEHAERQRRSEALFQRMARGGREERERLADGWWRENVERPRAARRIQRARKEVPAPTQPTRPERTARNGREKRAAVRTATTTPTYNLSSSN
jgi:hypothetical protein